MDTKEKFNFLYGNKTGAEAFDKYQKLVEKYRKRIKNVPGELSEKDIILISYGDHVQDEK